MTAHETKTKAINAIKDKLPETFDLMIIIDKKHLNFSHKVLTYSEALKIIKVYIPELINTYTSGQEEFPITPKYVVAACLLNKEFKKQFLVKIYMERFSSI